MHEINAILERIRSSDDQAAINDLLQQMATFIYKFPRIRRKEKIVEAGEFYEYAWSKLSDGNRLKSFDPSKGDFNPWFTKVLDNFLNTLITLKLKDQKKLETIDLDVDSLEIIEPTTLEIIVFNEDKQNINRTFSELNDTEKAVAICHTLFYKDISSGELIFLSEFSKKEINIISREIEELLNGELQDEQARIQKESQKITTLYRSLLNLESSLSDYQSLIETYPSRDEFRKQFEKLEFGIWKKRIKYIQLSRIHRRGKGLVLLKNRRIAELLNLKEGTVTSAVTRIRKKINQNQN
jgi:RNA polymerase sigma factor (sigma-70 family)